MVFYVYLSKILPVLVLPPGVFVVLALLALFFIFRGKRKTAAGTLTIAIVVIWFASMPIIANKLSLAIESSYPAVDLNEVPDSDCVVLLGGFVLAPIPPRRDIELRDAVDRVFKAAELYLAGKAPVVIVAGGRQPWSKSSSTEADLIRQLLVRLQVPGTSILVESMSRNTWENAIFSREIIENIGCKKPLLVTSAAHMPRSVAAFERAGVSVFPVSTDINATFDGNYSFIDYLPQANALSTTTGVLREWIGQKVYSYKGWN